MRNALKAITPTMRAKVKLTKKRLMEVETAILNLSLPGDGDGFLISDYYHIWTYVL